MRKRAIFRLKNKQGTLARAQASGGLKEEKRAATLGNKMGALIVCKKLEKKGRHALGGEEILKKPCTTKTDRSRGS